MHKALRLHEEDLEPQSPLPRHADQLGGLLELDSDEDEAKDQLEKTGGRRRRFLRPDASCQKSLSARTDGR